MIEQQYHQGPEWVFPMGWFLKAYLMFDTKVGLGKDVSLVFLVLEFVDQC